MNLFLNNCLPKKSNEKSDLLGHWQTFLLVILFFFWMIKGLTGLKYIFLYANYLLFLYRLLSSNGSTFDLIRSRITKNKVLTIPLALFLFSFVLSSFLGYGEFDSSIYSLIKYYLHPLLIGAIILSIHQYQTLLQWMLVSLSLALFYDIVRYLIEGYRFWNHTHHIDRNFTTYMQFLYPFALASFFVSKSKRWKLPLLYGVIIPAIILVLFSGVRGAWLAISFETLIFLFFVYKISHHTISWKKTLLISGMILTLLLLSSIIAYHSNNFFKMKVDRGFTLTGRDVILTDRLPLLFESDCALFGIGIAKDVYNDFMRQHQAPVNHPMTIRYEKGRLLYNHDEPFVIQLLYHFGFFGMLSGFFLLLASLRETIHGIFESNSIEHRLILTGLATGLSGVFLVRGLFENLSINHFLLYIFLSIYFTSFNMNERGDE